MIIHLKLEIDVGAELTESFASWLVTCPTKNYGRRQGMYIHDQAHRILTSLCHTTRNLEGEGRESMFPASKRRRLSMNTENTSPESFDINDWLTTENEVLNVGAGGAAFFTPFRLENFATGVVGA
jgi:hypothetical protein